VKAPLLFAKGSVVLLAGLALGYAVGISAAQDAERGRELTLKAYIADFEHYKAKLQSARIPMVGSLLAGVAFAVATFLSYELLALALAKAVIAVDRRTAHRPDEGLGRS
jgi:hypothetical protein